MRSALFLLLALQPFAAYAQQRGGVLQVGTVQLRVGMRKADVITNLTDAGFDLHRDTPSCRGCRMMLRNGV